VEIKNKYILLIAGVALIAGTYFYTGLPSSSFGFVALTDIGTAGHDALTICGYLLGTWMAYDALKRIRRS
jgi:hypothetical protein